MESDCRQFPSDCRHWVRKGVCFYGDKCRFAHDPAKQNSYKPKLKLRKSGHKRQQKSNDCQNSVFRRFLIDVFGDLLCGGVLVVAGGNGTLGLELHNFNDFPTILFDPRPFQKFDNFARRASFGIYHRTVCFQKYNTVSVADLIERGVRMPTHIRLFFSRWCWCAEDPVNWEEEKQRAKDIRWTSTGLKANQNEEELDLQLPVSSPEELRELLQSVSVIVGLHPDQATEAIVDFAIASGKPYAIVPCCVYPGDFPKRRDRLGGPVRTYEQFIGYLKAKHEGVQEETLAFSGRNKVLYWNP